MSEDRSLRVIPLATRVVELLHTEPDPEVQIAAFDVAKIAVDAKRARMRRKPESKLTKAALATLLRNYEEEL